MRMKIGVALAIVLFTLPAAAKKSRPVWEASDLLTAESMLDGVCRGSMSENEDMRGYSCQARQAVDSALDKLGWCYGKNWQIEADMRWHKCTKDSLHTDLKTLHSYDWDETTHSYINQDPGRPEGRLFQPKGHKLSHEGGLPAGRWRLKV